MIYPNILNESRDNFAVVNIILIYFSFNLNKSKTVRVEIWSEF